MLGKTPDSIVAVKPLSDGVISDIDSTRAMMISGIHKKYMNQDYLDQKL